MSGPTNITTQSSAKPELLAWSALYCFASRCLVDPLLAPFARVADVDTADPADQSYCWLEEEIKYV